MHIPAVYLISPLHTPAAMVWNIKTLGWISWLQCLVENCRLAFAEHYTSILSSVSREHSGYIGARK